MLQKVGCSGKSIKAFQEFKERQNSRSGEVGEGQGERLRIKKANVALRNVVKWKRIRKEKDEEGEGEDEQEDEQSNVPQYASRMLKCTTCQETQETRTMQLYTHEGFRGIHCKSCGRQERCLYNECQCGTVWHQCLKHRVDPPVHASRKGIKKVKAKKQKGKVRMQESSMRKAPNTEPKK